jgi:hypothetical protein
MGSRRRPPTEGQFGEADELLPLAQVFGGAFALLITLFLMIHNLSGAGQSRSLPPRSPAQTGPIQISWLARGSGWTVIARPDRVRIVQDGQEAFQGRICETTSPFRKYVRDRYKEGMNVVLVVLDGGVDVALEARNSIWEEHGEGSQVGWIIADLELLKSLSVDKLPAHVQAVADAYRALH